jgi:PAS domain S-box-containing protein
VLLVEDDPADARLVGEMLRGVGSRSIALTHAAKLHVGLEHLRAGGFNAVLLDLTLPDSDGLDTFRRARAEAARAPIVVLTGLSDLEVASRAVREGAQDYLIKGEVDGEQLYRSIRYAVERREAEEHLRESEERFRQLVENIKEAFVLVELPEYRPLYLSHIWEEIWGRKIEEAHREPQLWIDAVHPDDRPAVERAMRALERGHPSSNVFRVMRPDASVRWVRARMFPIVDRTDRVYRLVGLVEDITEMRRTEEQLLHAQKMEAVGRLAGAIAHDFNNMLTAILGYSGLVLDDLGPAHPVHDDVHQIRTAAESAERLTRQLLAFSRRQILQPQNLDLNDVLRRIEPLLQRAIGEDISLVMGLQTRLPTVSADPGQIEQVVMNLAINARDAMPRGGRLIVETGLVDLDQHYVARHPGAAPGPHVMLAVSDTGVGMDRATQQRLFEPFFTTKEAGKGTGLGLATVYGIVKQSRGSIWVYSEPNRGTTFKIYLPVTAGEPGVHAAPSVGPATLSGTETVLIVEDQAEVRSVIRELLRRRGYTVLEAPSSTEAVELARNHLGPIHILLVDVVMPGTSGRHAAAQLHGIRPEMRVIYMSGYTDQAIVDHGILDAGLAFVQKPFTGDVLLRKIREVLGAPEPPRR